MSLPAKFPTPEVYFESCVQFLRRYAWVYQHANTSFLRAAVLEHMEPSEQEYFINVSTDELNRFPIVDSAVSESLPTSLQEFRTRLKDLIPADAFDGPTVGNLDSAAQPSFRKMSVKKQHEICRLADVINEVCHRDEVLIDFGAGLGYLSERLYDANKDYRILGLEADERRVETARKRLVANIPAAQDRIVYKQQLITESSAPFIEQSVQELLDMSPRSARPPASWTIVGLHACADLTITSMRLFLAMPAVRRLVIMPCCYHKLKTSAPSASSSPSPAPTQTGFVNFPLSRSLREAVANDPEVGAYLNRPFLRLACQQTLARWRRCSAEQHVAHGSEMWQRAVADVIVDEHEAPVKRRDRRKAHGEPPLTFESLCESYELKSLGEQSELPWRAEHERRFEEIHRKYLEQGPRLAEGLTCLQSTMQKLCENVVLYDRSCYLKESAGGLELRVRYEKLMDEELSPRCYVLIAEKLT